MKGRTMKRYKKSMKKQVHSKKTKKRNKYGGDREQIRDIQFKKKRFRQNFKDLVIQITNKKNINQAVNSIIKDFNNLDNINTLIPISNIGKPLDVDTYTKKNPIVDFVSPVMVIFDNLSGKISENDIVRLLTAYYKNGGNMNAPSNRFKITPFENEVRKKRIENIKLLLNRDYPFHIIEDGLSAEIKEQLSELIPTEQKITSTPNNEINTNTSNINVINDIPYPSEEDYNRDDVPEFWKPMFNDGEELTSLKNTFMNIYELDKYTENVQKRFHICDLLEKLIPTYLTKYSLHNTDTPKTLVTMNILNCFITLLYGIITYKLYEHNQDYLLLFKGGRAVQLSLTDIPNVTKYFSEDADILIIPNKATNAPYNEAKMKNLSYHIAYLIKWFIPPEINIIVTLPNTPKNPNSEITKIIYNDEKVYKALSDIGFGTIKEDIERYFNNPSYSPFYVDDFETTALFITPTIDDILSEKLYFYAKYYVMLNKIRRREPILEKGYEQVNENDCEYYMHKFNRAIKYIVQSIVRRDYSNLEMLNKAENTKDENINALVSNKVIIPDMDPQFKKYPNAVKENIYNRLNEISRLILRGIISHFDDYSNVEKEEILHNLYP